ncbi:hypothetical protein COOONC_25578 [Cooperia oncophora]
MKEAAEICIQNYKKQLLQKEEALRIFRELAEEKLAASSRPIVEKEIIREEVRVKDEETEERLKQSFGEVARLKEELEELEKANRALYRKQRQSVTTALNTVECQTDTQTEDTAPVEKDVSIDKNEQSRNSPEMDDFEPSTEKKMEAERARYKNEIKQHVAKDRDRPLWPENQLLRKATTRIKESDEQAMLKIRYDLERIRKENKMLRKTVDEQKSALDSLKKTTEQGQKNPEVNYSNSSELQSEISKWNERKKLEENLSSVKRKLSDDELLKKELDRAQRRVAQIQEEKDELLRKNHDRSKLKSRLNEKVDELEKKAEEVSALSIRLETLQEEYSKLTREYERTKAELEHREAASRRVELYSKAIQAVTWASTQCTQTSDHKVTQIEKVDRAVEVRGATRPEQPSEMKVIVAMDDTLVFQFERKPRKHGEW